MSRAQPFTILPVMICVVLGGDHGQEQQTCPLWEMNLWNEG